MMGLFDDYPENQNLSRKDEWRMSDFDSDQVKYWHQRHRLWSRYEDGIWMTKEAWFGCTPESIANKIAEHTVEDKPAGKTILVDAFAGVGGNSIAFAMRGGWEMIFGIERDPATLDCARHNAEIYGVENKIVWIQGDCFKEIPKRFAGNDKVVIFASPPWGGTEYGVQDVFDLSVMKPYSLGKIYEAFSKITNTMVLYLPRNSDLNQIARLVPEGKKIEVSHYCIVGASKALCAYLGDFRFNVELTSQVKDVARIEETSREIEKPM